jgi:SAM-dependent methyltransferase
MSSTGPTLPLRCPGCRDSRLERRGEKLVCVGCEAEYATVDGIPVVLPPYAGGEHKLQQARFTDHEVDEEWEITRPHGAPAFYRWLLSEKFDRSIRALPVEEGASVLTVCGGSGLDAEYLARTGARVVCTDISVEAARRTRERARRFGLEITPLVADVENLPFADASFDVVYVHDGLHHLEDPLLGLDEMARVASGGVSVNEPARAALTALAVRLGLALAREEAGNPVARLTVDQVAERLRSHGFRPVEARRFAMLYRHEPGLVSRLLSRPWSFPLGRAGYFALDRAVGRFGNKLTVQATRAAG